MKNIWLKGEEISIVLSMVTAKARVLQTRNCWCNERRMLFVETVFCHRNSNRGHTEGEVITYSYDEDQAKRLQRQLEIKYMRWGMKIDKLWG